MSLDQRWNKLKNISQSIFNFYNELFFHIIVSMAYQADTNTIKNQTFQKINLDLRGKAFLKFSTFEQSHRYWVELT